MKKLIWVFTIIGLVAFLGLLVATLISNNAVDEVLQSRDTRLDVRENTKFWVMEDMRTYLEIDNVEDFKAAKDAISPHLTQDVHSDLFGGDVYARAFSGFDQVSFVDAQYTVEGTDNFMVYLLANVKDGDTMKSLNMVVSVDKNKIYDIIVY